MAAGIAEGLSLKKFLAYLRGIETERKLNNQDGAIKLTLLNPLLNKRKVPT